MTRSRFELVAEHSWRHDPRRFAGFLAGRLLLALMAPLLLASLRGLVNAIAGAQEWSVGLVVLLGGAAAATTLRPALTPFLDKAEDVYTNEVVSLARLRMMGALANADMGRYDDPDFVDGAARAHEAVLWRPEKITVAAMAIASSTVELVGVSVVLLQGGLLPGLLVLSGALAAAGADVLLERRLVDVATGRDLDIRRGIAYSSPVRQAANATEVRVGGMADFFLDKWWEAENRARRLMLRAAATTIPIAALAALATGGALLGALLVLDREGASPGAVAVAIGGLAALATAVHRLAGRAGRLNEDVRLLSAAYRLLDLPPLLPRPAQPRPIVERPVGISLRGVRFGYPGGHAAVLDGVDLEIGAGEVVALVGENGAGKTTLVRLLLRLYDPTEGSITMGGVDLRDADPEEVRSLVGVLVQDALQLKVRLRDNVGFGRWQRPADDDAVNAAVDAALARPVVTDAGGLDAYVGQFWRGGHELSGGQWQRLFLARHAFRDADIWIMDEPTSALDPEAEAEVFRRLRERLAGRTGIIVSHRLSSVRLADRIAVLHDGRIVEQGSHDELLVAGGPYAALFEAQAAAYR